MFAHRCFHTAAPRGHSPAMSYEAGLSHTCPGRGKLTGAGQDVSPWHDVPLEAGAGTYNFICEIPKETSAKMEVATVCTHHAICCLWGNEGAEHRAQGHHMAVT